MYLEMQIHKVLPGFALQVSLSCEAGILVLFGASGAGKSLTLQCLAGIVRPDSGRILVGGEILFDDGRGVDVPPQHRRMGYVPQDYALFPHMTVAENIGFGLRRWPSRLIAREVSRLLDLLRLEGLGTRRPMELSGGQQQRVALARALATSPRLLLLDEPFSALDAPLRDALRADLCEVHRELGVGIVFVTHGVAETHVMAQTVAVYRGGHVLQVGPPAEIFQRPATAEVARLTGVRNLLAARVLEGTREGVWLQVGGVRLRAAGRGLAPGTRVLAAIRPEYARFLDEGDPPEQREEPIPGVMLSATNQGHLYSVQVALGCAEGARMQVLTPVWWWERHGAPVGGACTLAIPQDSVHVLPEDPSGATDDTRVAVHADVESAGSSSSPLLGTLSEGSKLS